MSSTFKLIIEYDGSTFSGWQKQPDRRTIQGEIEKALSYMLNQPLKITGSGRTDAGVHAWAQVASFKAKTRLLPDQIKKGLNSIIKSPIVIHDCTIVPDDFHAQYSAVSKEYHYCILNREDPCAIKQAYVWHIRPALDIRIMNECCSMIIGTFDFKSFENRGSPKNSTIREVFYSHVENIKKDHLVFKICASGFLKYMVRNLVSTIVLAGLGKISVNEFEMILKAKDRTKAGATAPAHGLFLKQVNYS